jgi:DNA-directed RNA polymerase specialized sigma24 family protein
MKRKTVYVHAENKADQLKKTDQRKRYSYTYKFPMREQHEGRNVDFIEEFEIIPGQDGVNEEDIKALYSIEDSEVYYNLKARRPNRDAEEKEMIETWKTDFITAFLNEHGYKPTSEYVDDAAKEAFPRNWTDSLDRILSSDDEDGFSDKSSALFDLWNINETQGSAFERILEIVSTLSKEDQEIFQYVILEHHSAANYARMKGRNERVIQRKVKRIYEKLRQDPELKKHVRNF